MSLVTTRQSGVPTPPVQDQYALRQANSHSQHGMPISFQQDYFEGSSFLPAAPASTFNSPRQGQVMVDEFGIPYGNHYGHLAGSPYQDQMYQSPMQQHTYPNPGLYGRVPTPDHTNITGNSQRHSRTIAPNSFSRDDSPPKRRKVPKKENAKRSKLEKPLSILTAHLDHIPIKDTEAWVNRPVEIRRKEIGKDGFVKRPSNSFILYRSAYADRCREYEKSNNHQDISSMAGTSWGMESPKVRKQYEEWAKIERENHHAAFPDYKFQPQTQEAKARKRKEKFDDESLEDSDPNDLTYMGRGMTPDTVRSGRTKKARKNFRESSYTPSVASEPEWGSPKLYPSAIYNASYYQSANPGKPTPSVFDRLGPNDGYYQAVSHPNLDFADIGHVEDVTYRPADQSLGDFGSPIPTGLPGMSHEDLMGDGDLSNGHLTFTGPSLDPELMSFNHGMPEDPEDHGQNNFRAQDFLGDEHKGFGVDEGQTNLLGKWDRFEDGF